MKKIFICVTTILFCLCFAGCGKYDKDDLIKNFSKKVDESNSYNLSGTLEIINNEEVYSYDVNVSYKKENNFKVSLKNKINNYEQIILRNSDGVFVLTPSLNKNFKFQSEWPYNSSQSYLLHTILEDLENDENSKFEETSDGYMIQTKANYTSNKELSYQKIYFDKQKEIYKVEVYDSNNIVKITMNINSIQYNVSFDDNYFNLNQDASTGDIQEETSKTIEQVIYPMYMPENTYLSSEYKVSSEEGQRIIMTFAGENSFMLIQETATVAQTADIIPTDGEPCFLVDTVGILTDNSIEWISNGVEYYLISNDMSKDELITVVKSLSVMPVGK